MPDVPPPSFPVAAPPPAGESVSTGDVPRQLAAAQAAWRPVGRAVRYARFDAWTLAACGVLSLPCMGVDAAGVVVAMLLCAIAYVEFRGAGRLRRLDPTAPRLLAVNQLVLAGAVFLYCLWNLYLTSENRGLIGVLMSQGLDQSGPEMVASARTILYAMYAGLAVIGPGATLGAAWFYSSRTAHLNAYLANTPAWIVGMQRERGSL